jgi:hypothetical protein
MRGNSPPLSSFTWKARSVVVLLHIVACDPLSLSHTHCTLSHSLTHAQAHTSHLVSLSHTCTYSFVFSFSLFPSCMLGKLVLNWQPISHQPFMRKTSFERKHMRTHTNHTCTQRVNVVRPKTWPTSTNKRVPL